MPFNPTYTITPNIIDYLKRIEEAKKKVADAPLTHTILKSLRESAKLYTTHYSTMIEGNKLSADQIEAVIQHEGHFPGRERDEHEVKGYYAALTEVEQWSAQHASVTEKTVQTIHGLVISHGKAKVKPTPYRDGQNVIRNGLTREIVYLPPEAQDVPQLMHELVAWINDNPQQISCPLIAAIAHYQFATIHPYYDGNGRTARLLITLILHLGGYGLKGLYSLEEYYARNLGAYYEAISIGDSHNYYMGRAEADITKWIEYFTKGMAIAFENVLKYMQEAKKQGHLDNSELINQLDPQQRKVLELFQFSSYITSRQISELFGFKPRVSAVLCNSWVKDGFLTVMDASKKSKKYGLAERYLSLVKSDIA